MKPITKNQRNVPDVGSDLIVPPEQEFLLAAREILLEGFRLADLTRPGLSLDKLNLRGCELERIRWPGSAMKAVSLRDVRVVGCDFSNLTVHRFTLVRVEFVECRLAGLRASAADWQDVLVRDCDLRYAVFEEGKFRRCEFERANCEDSGFPRADFTGCAFRSSSLSQADFRGAKLGATDLRGSTVDGMIVGIEDLRGAIVDPVQAAAFARLMGLQIE